MREAIRKISFIFWAIMILLFNKIPCYAAEIPDISTPSYAVIDACSGEILYSKNGEIPIYPASSVKLVTAMVVIDSVPLDKTIVVTNKMLQHVPADAAQIGLRAGGEYTVYELLHMLLISSAADAAQVLAEGCFQSYDECVLKMNEKVMMLGLKQTMFDNVIGLDIGNGYTNTYTTPHDFVQLCRYAMSYDVIREIVKMPAYSIAPRTNNNGFSKKSTNRFYSIEPYSREMYTVIGSKTGTTCNAGNVLVTTATDGVHEVICVSFKNGTRHEAYTETRKVLDYIFTMKNAGNLSLASLDYHEWYLFQPNI